jgi:hypothetical protein
LDEQITLGSLLERLRNLASAPAAETRVPTSFEAAYDGPTCERFVRELPMSLIERSIVLYEALAADGRIDSVELANRLGTTPSVLSGTLTTHLKQRAQKLGLPYPFDGGRGAAGYGGISDPQEGDDPDRTTWADRGGVAARMVQALTTERDRRSAQEGSADDDRVEAERLLGESSSKSEVMRRLHEAGWSRSRIARAMGVRYQFVNNVLKNAGLL